VWLIAGKDFITFNHHENINILECFNVHNYSMQRVKTEWPFYVAVDLGMNHLLEVS
jgi:hypothetical protein